MIILFIFIFLILLFVYSCLRISSKCSRMEEEWQRQEYGKSKRD